MNPQDRYSSCAELLYALQHYEEEDEAYKKQLKRKLKIFVGTLVASVVCVLAGVTCQAISTKMNNDDYESYLLRAEKSATYQERVQNCLDAIYVKPNEIEAYKKLIEAYKEDAVFTVDEEAQFKSAINSQLKELSNSKGYADLAFETGKLYWYFYDYGKTAEQDNQVTRMKSAIQWFEDACTYATEENDAYRMASVYKEIGKFNQDVTIKVEEASDQGMYLPYYQNLKKLIIQ